MKKILSFTAAFIIFMIGTMAFNLWMSPGLTWIHWIGYVISAFIIAVPVWEHWFTKTKNWFN